MQEFELWWLLSFPAFFGLGWLAARIDMRAVLAQARSVPDSYFRGLHALLDDDSEMAVHELQQVVRAQPRAYELELVLGRLHRRRGENDLAIRLHQKMLQQAELPSHFVERVRVELAQDFLRAGLVDRAEELFLSLENSALLGRDARQFLLGIYQQERNWLRAIDMAQALRSESMSYQRELAQFHCELAQSHLYKSEFTAARQHIDAALVANRRCARASLIAGDLAKAEGRLEDAITAWMEIETQAPTYLSLVAERVLDTYEALGRLVEGLTLMRGLARSLPELGLAQVLYAYIVRVEGESAALEFLRESVHAYPTLSGLAQLIDARVGSLEAEQRQDIELAQHLVSNQVRRLSVHRCKNCHFRARTFYWHCPACNEWETFTPNRSESTVAA